ncbi:VOC family protein [Spirillospora sp. NPDC047279]|uniref:VOC family protein n=1 Tax=Spirillospora sp. NPDC047279 TaxID=3155478 RepID=UPI0033E1E849
MDVLSSRILLRPRDLERSRRFYRDVLGLAVYREFGPPDSPGMVFFLGPGFLEISGGHSPGTDAVPEAPADSEGPMIWLQVRDVRAEHERLAAAGVTISRGPREEPWGLIEMWITDPESLRIVLVEVPEAHPLRRDQRT